MKKEVPDADIPEHGFKSETMGKGSDAKALSTVTMKNSHAATRTATHSNSEAANVHAQIAAFNSLIALARYHETIDESVSQ
jgi:hypothetical protein